jgi:shikimate dehydrogenase
MSLPAFLPCAVIGQPIAHSLSPRLHAAFAQQFQRELNYQRIEANAEQFRREVGQFFAQGGRGLNVTLPHKISAFEMADVRLPRAQWAGAANTLWQQDGLLYADNSDGVGLLNDLKRLHISLRDKHIVILGAGGAAAGVLPLLLAEQPTHIQLLNRNVERAENLCATLNDTRLSTHFSAPPDLLISTVSSGFEQLIAPLAIKNSTLVYDLNYGERASNSQQWAKSQPLNWHDGLGMLIEQAAVSFALWHGVTPNTAALHQGAF